jgi:DNA ligase-1
MVFHHAAPSKNQRPQTRNRMNESQFTLGSDYQGGADPTGWLVSEKLNGCRAYYDGEQFWTRGGNVIAAPGWFTAGLPGVPLDGEIWAGRGRFEEARCAVQYGHWTRRCRFVAFDAPDVPGRWQERIAEAGRLWRDTVTFEVCQGRRWLMQRLLDVQRGGGEGLMIRSPVTIGYETGRTVNTLKVKTVI